MAKIIQLSEILNLISHRAELPKNWSTPELGEEHPRRYTCRRMRNITPTLVGIIPNSHCSRVRSASGWCPGGFWSAQDRAGTAELRAGHSQGWNASPRADPTCSCPWSHIFLPGSPHTPAPSFSPGLVPHVPAPDPTFSCPFAFPGHAPAAPVPQDALCHRCTLSPSL